MRVIPSIELRVNGEVEGINGRVVQSGLQVNAVAIIKLDERLPRPMPCYADVSIDVVQLRKKKMNCWYY